MGSAQAAPAPPDPYKVSSAEGKSNVQTALANSVLGNPNTYGPTGSTTYAQSGEMQTITLPDGSTTQVPRYNQTTTLSPEQQKLYDLNTKTQANIGQIGVDQSQRIGDLLGKPVDYSDLNLDPNNFSADRQRVEQAMYERMTPQLDRELSAERNRLTNMGAVEGSEAYKGAMDDYNRRINDLRLGITSNGLAEQQGMYGMARDAAGYEMSRRAAERNAPINEITALMSGSQVSMPNAPGYNAPTIAGTNLGSNVYNSAALANQQWQQQQQNNNAAMGGMFGLGQAGILGATSDKGSGLLKAGMAALPWMSDRRLKRDIRDLGISLMSGVRLYAYKYLWETRERVGVMADELAKVRPDAVMMTPSGYLAVDYGAL